MGIKHMSEERWMCDAPGCHAWESVFPGGKVAPPGWVRMEITLCESPGVAPYDVILCRAHGETVRNLATLPSYVEVLPPTGG